MPGPVALVGAGEFLPAMAEFDAELLAATGRARPRVAILPTASYPDGEEVFERWAAMGVAHFAALGAEVEPVLVRDRAGGRRCRGAPRRSARPTSIYLSGGKPGHLLRGAGGQRGRRGARARRTSEARSWPAARPGRWSSPATPSTSGRACCRGRCAGGAASGSPRASGHAPLRRLARADVGADRAPGAARVGRARDRRGDRRRRPRRRRGRSTARSRVTVWRGRHRERYPGRRGLPRLGDPRPASQRAGPRQSGWTVRKQSEQ